MGDVRKRDLFALASGNALAFYDFVTYAFFSLQIGQALFPATSAQWSLLESLATFGAGFLTRPVGAIVIGRFADRAGRRPATLLSFALLGLAIAGLAMTPSYRRIGLAAPLLAILFRLLQGFALGGEVGASTILLLEASPLHRRGLYVSLLTAGSDVAVLAAGLVGYGISSTMPGSALTDWGWRAALLFGVLILPVGFWVRLSLPETPTGTPTACPSPPDRRFGARSMAPMALAILVSGTTATYGLDYLTTYAETTLHLAPATSLTATIIVGLSGAMSSVLGGWLSDRFGRRPIIIGAFCMLLAGALPGFLALAWADSRMVLWIVAFLLGSAAALPAGAALAAIGEALDERSRARTFGLLYAVAISVFGGSTQLAIAWLVSVQGALAPAWYLTLCVTVGLIAAIAFPETAPARIGKVAARSEAEPT